MKLACFNLVLTPSISKKSSGVVWNFTQLISIGKYVFLIRFAFLWVVYPVLVHSFCIHNHISKIVDIVWMIQDNIVVFIYSKPKNYYFSSTLHAKNLCLKWFGFFEHIITPLQKSSTLQQITPSSL